MTSEETSKRKFARALLGRTKLRPIIDASRLPGGETNLRVVKFVGCVAWPETICGRGFGWGEGGGWTKIVGILLRAWRGSLQGRDGKRVGIEFREIILNAGQQNKSHSGAHLRRCKATAQNRPPQPHATSTKAAAAARERAQQTPQPPQQTNKNKQAMPT